MPCSACGSATSATSPPSSSIRASVALEDLAHAGLDPVARASSRGTPKRRPLRSSRPGSSTPPSIPTEVESQGSRPSHRREQQRGVGDVAGQRPALVERGGEGDHPVARDRAVGRLQADDPAERGRLADRAAGVGADRAGREAAGDGRGRAAGGAAGHPLAVPGVAAPGRRPSSRSRSPSRTRPCWSCRAPARRPRRACARRSPCRAAGSPRGSASRPWSATPSVQKMSLTAIGIAAQRARRRPSRRRRPRPRQR